MSPSIYKAQYTYTPKRAPICLMGPVGLIGMMFHIVSSLWLLLFDIIRLLISQHANYTEPNFHDSFASDICPPNQCQISFRNRVKSPRTTDVRSKQDLLFMDSAVVIIITVTIRDLMMSSRDSPMLAFYIHFSSYHNHPVSTYPQENSFKAIRVPNLQPHIDHSTTDHIVESAQRHIY